MTTFAKDFRISLGLASTRGKLLTIKATAPKDASFNLICPACQDEQLKQYLVGACGHHPESAPGYTKDQVLKGQKVDDKWIVVTEEQAKAATASTRELNALDLNIHDIAEVESQTWASGAMYWFQPDRETDEFFELLAEYVGHYEHAYIGVVNLRGNDKLVRLQPHNGGVVVQELLRPEEVNEFAHEPFHVATAQESVFNELVNAVVKPFDPAEYKSDRADKVRSLVDNAEELPLKTKADEKALLDQLEAALAAAKKAKKPAAKKTSKKKAS